jgi:hypothetical protein
MRPNGLELSAVRKAFVYFHGWIRFSVGAFDDQSPVMQANNRLPFHDTARVQPLGCVLADYLALIRHKASNFMEKPAHPWLSSNSARAARSFRPLVDSQTC